MTRSWVSAIEAILAWRAEHGADALAPLLADWACQLDLALAGAGDAPLEEMLRAHQHLADGGNGGLVPVNGLLLELLGPTDIEVLAIDTTLRIVELRRRVRVLPLEDWLLQAGDREAIADLRALLTARFTDDPALGALLPLFESGPPAAAPATGSALPHGRLGPFRRPAPRRDVAKAGGR